MAINKTPAPDPRAEGLAAIAAWGEWFRNAHHERLRDSPDQHFVAAERAQIDALATAITERMKSDYLARRHP